MEKRVKFTMSATDFIKSVGTVRQSGEKLFYRIPFWFESTDDPNVFIQQLSVFGLGEGGTCRKPKISTNVSCHFCQTRVMCSCGCLPKMLI